MSDNNGGLYNLINAHEKRIAEQQARIEALEKAARALVKTRSVIYNDGEPSSTLCAVFAPRVDDIAALLQEPSK